MATRTLIQIAEAVADRLGALEQGTVTSVTTAAATVATSPFKTASSNANSNKYVGDEWYWTNGQFTPAASQIITYAPSTGVFTPAAAWTDGGTDPTTFDIFKRGLTFTMLSTAINRALRRMRYVSIVPLSILADADCDESDATSWGTAVSATASKVTAAANMLRGTRALRVLNSGANGYLPTAAHSVRYSREYYMQANVRADVGTANLRSWDSTNGAVITSETYDQRGWGRISGTFTTPATCESLTLRLGATGASDDAYWDDVMLLPTGAREIALPSYITDENQVRQVYRGIQDDVHDEEHYRPYYWWEVRADESNPNNQFKLALYPGITGPVWLEVSRAPSALSAATDTCFLDRDWVEIAAVCEMLDMLINARSPGAEAVAWKLELRRRQPEKLRLDHKFMPKPLLRTGFATPPYTVGAHPIG